MSRDYVSENTVVTFKAPPRLVDELDKKAKKLRISRSELIRNILIEGLRNEYLLTQRRKVFKVKRVVLQ